MQIPPKNNAKPASGAEKNKPHLLYSFAPTLTRWDLNLGLLVIFFLDLAETCATILTTDGF